MTVPTLGFLGLTLEEFEALRAGPTSEAWGSVQARAKQATSQLRVGSGRGEGTGGEFTKKILPAIGQGGPHAGKPGVGRTGDTDPSTLFRDDGKTIFGHTLPPEARQVTDPAERKKTRVPPGYPLAYTTPDGNPLENGIVGWGVDSKGRIKRFYTDESNVERQKQKYERLRRLTAELSKLDATLIKDAKTDDTAALVMLIRATGMRPGSERETGGETQAFGATTLQAQHVEIDGDLVAFNFVGKNGKDVHFDVHNAVLAAALEPHLAGKDGEEPLFPGVNERTGNRFLKDTVGEDFKLKDLRTLLATSVATKRLSEMEIPESPKERKALRKQICTEISERLGNEPAEVQKSYVDPGVWNALGL